MTRVSKLDGVHNFRRFCGYDAEGGARVRGGLYRSGQFSRASAADLDHIGGLEIAVVADLRRPPERRREPSPWGAEHAAPAENGPRVIASDHGDDVEPPHMRFLKKGDYSPEAVRQFMLSAYRRIPNEKGNQTVFREGFKALAAGEADRGFLVHCAAGKDRTGIFCALVLTELGVDQDTVMEDYLLTNTAVDYDSLIPLVQERMRNEYGAVMPESEMRAFMGVDADYLNEAFNEIGDRRRYLTETLGVSEAEINALRTRWLEG